MYNADMFRLLMRDLFDALRETYRGRHILWHVLAAALTALLVLSGFDWWFFKATRIESLTPLIFAAGIGGFFVPVLVPVSLFVWGELRKDTRSISAGIASGQAVIIAWVISSFYKALTGRIEPEFLTNLLDDRSRTFNFGFFEYGIFWGWPSSHTAVAFALATAVSLVFRRDLWPRALAFTYASLVAAGAAVGFHWFSDVLAGAMVGSLVGYVVATSFLRKHVVR